VDVIERIKVWVGACAASTEIENLKDAAEKGQRAVWAAQGAAMFTKTSGESIEKLGKAGQALGKVGESLGKVQGICLDIKAVNQIHAAIKVLSQDGIIERDSDAAALAFGKLFVGFGRLAHHLPPPVNAYAQILEGCGDFFYNMNQKLDPSKRWKKQFSEIEGFN
jgi:hypothetical protein